LRGKVALFCEGKQDDSNDARFYQKIFETAAFADEVLVQSLGGKEGLHAAAQGFLLGRKSYTPTIILTISDRDFDVDPIIESSHLRPSMEITTKMFKVRTGRSCLESYFLEPELVYTFESSTQNRFTREQIENAFNDSLAGLAGYQASRWALSKQLRQWFPGNVRFRTSWLNKDGDLPSDSSLAYCKNKSIEYRNCLATHFGQMVDICELSNEYFAQFSSAEFASQNGYKIWYHGKDLQAALSAKLLNFSFQYFYDWCIDKCQLANFEDFRDVEGKIIETN
jgi:hypothetical protein